MIEPNSPENASQTAATIPVWDLVVRLGHWLLAGGVLLAFASGEHESWELLHVSAGAVAGSVAAYRILWGFTGSRHARFAAFLRGPAAVKSYLLSLAGRQPEHYTGHNPAGGWAIVLLLGLSLLTALSGATTHWNWLGSEQLTDAMGEVHEALANTLIAVVAVHVAGVIIGSLRHRESLVVAMFTGKKRGSANEASHGNAALAAALLLLLAATAVALALSLPA